jgi:hypothetical protein
MGITHPVGRHLFLEARPLAGGIDDAADLRGVQWSAPLAAAEDWVHHPSGAADRQQLLPAPGLEENSPGFAPLPKTVIWPPSCRGKVSHHFNPQSSLTRIPETYRSFRIIRSRPSGAASISFATSPSSRMRWARVSRLGRSFTAAPTLKGRYPISCANDSKDLMAVKRCSTVGPSVSRMARG